MEILIMEALECQNEEFEFNPKIKRNQLNNFEQENGMSQASAFA